jgi:hypothetical protein
VVERYFYNRLFLHFNIIHSITALPS